MKKESKRLKILRNLLTKPVYSIDESIQLIKNYEKRINTYSKTTKFVKRR